MDYPHHTGHGLGVTPHQFPRIVPDSAWTLEPGMVIALEPGTYAEDWGLRVEHVVLVTADGCDTLSRHDLSL
jgi:Xaa-Pro aminopeptidase